MTEIRAASKFNNRLKLPLTIILLLSAEQPPRRESLSAQEFQVQDFFVKDFAYANLSTGKTICLNDKFRIGSST